MTNNQYRIEFTSDLSRGITVTPIRFALLSNENMAHAFVIKTTRNGQKNDLTGSNVRAYFIPASQNLSVLIDGEVDQNGNAVIELTKDCYYYTGRFFLIIETEMDNVTSCIFYGDGYVTKTSTDEIVAPPETVGIISAVLYNKPQSLTDAQKQQARANIGAVSSDEIALENVPNYVVTEAMSVLDKVVAAQGDRTFVLGAITDMHYGSSDYTDGVLHATQGLKHISDRIKMDALAVLGDYTDEHQIDTGTAVTDREECNALLQMIDVDRLCMKGNHDHTPSGAAQTYRTIMAYSDDVVWGSRIGGYFYRDFDAYKLRIICLNTTELARDNLSVSDEQYQWFADTLDISSKEDAAEWGILILSHHPLDWTVTDGAYKFVPIINAYVSGASWTGGAVSCNYASKNDAKIIANIHGHLHNLLTSKMYIGAPGSSAQIDVYRMCTPASRVDYVNHYSGVWKEGTTYNKTQNTANDTSFCVYCIDLDDFTIKAYCYGAGYDRELTYYEKPVEIINLIDTVGYTDGKRYSASSHGLKDAAGYTCTGEITLAMGDVIRTSGVNFNSNSYQYCNIACINDTTDWTITTGSGTSADMDFSLDASGNLTITPKNVKNNLRIRLTGYGSGANLVVTRNQVI